MSIAEGIRDGIASDAGDVRLRVRDDNAILNVESLDLRQSATRRPIISDKLCHDGDDIVRVHNESFAKEALVAQTEGIPVATVTIAVARVAGALVACALRLSCY